jgi:SAM-dependent methyltransferase
MSARSVKEQVREFYDSVGWKEIGPGVYQNARYEDLRPVSREYIHRCHMRVARHLPAAGNYLLDAGSGPIQYPEYLEYSRQYKARVCLDISALALKEARTRIGEHGLFVVGDIANLPFAKESIEGVVSLHTVHHLPEGEQKQAFFELFRVLKKGGRAAVVYSWGNASPLMWRLRRLIAFINRLKEVGVSRAQSGGQESPGEEAFRTEEHAMLRSPGTFTFKHDYQWVSENLKSLAGLEIRVWRSVSTAFLRTFIYPWGLGRFWLRLIYWLEERVPHFLGRYGQYPLILFQKPTTEPSIGEAGRNELE